MGVQLNCTVTMPSALWFKAGSWNDVQKPKHRNGFRGLMFFRMTSIVGSIDFRFALVVLLLLRKSSSRYLPLDDTLCFISNFMCVGVFLCFF